MSRTYKDIRNWKTSEFWHNYVNTAAPWNNYVSREMLDFIKKNKEYKSAQQLYTDYSGAPSWFTRLYSNIPKRREEKRLINDVLRNPEDADKLLFPLARRPFAYYW